MRKSTGLVAHFGDVGGKERVVEGVGSVVGGNEGACRYG